MNDLITPILMPKWGLSMKEGKLTAWHVTEGTEIAPGDDIMDVETDKIANVVEAADGGLLRRCVGQTDVMYPVQALLGVMAPASVSDAEVDAYVDAFEMPEIAEEDEDVGPAYEFADLPVGRIRYASRDGEGIPAILIHGFGGDLDNWLFNIDAIADDRPVHVLDLPGHGQSVKDVQAPDLAMMVSTIVAFMDHLDIDRAHLVGHSMGGLIAAKVALEHPGRVSSLGLICSAGLGPEINDDYISGFVNATSRRELKPKLVHLFADASMVSRSMVDDLLKYKRLDGVSTFLTALSGNLFANGLQTAAVADDLSNADIPVLVISGAEDAVIPAAHAQAIPRASRHVIKDAGHMVQMEAAAKVNDLIKSHM